VFDAGPGKKSRSVRLLGHAEKHRRRGGRLVVILVFMFGVGCSLLGLGRVGIAAPLGPSTPAWEWSRLSYSETTGFTIREDETSADQEPLATCDDVSVLVDRSHSLPSDYVPKDLVPLQDYGVPALGSEVLRREAAEHLGRLVEDAAVYGEELVVSSAYRSYEEQQLSHERLVSVFGAGAGRTSASAGHSQHQLGTAVDFTNAAAGYQVWELFAQTSAYWWLEHHAWEYGFVLAYPRGKEEQTGYQWEPWHYRYVGVENAKRLEESNLGLQEFLERAGTMPHC
jgi:zinc D-Ala-D-Ala carboxypeptidase